MRKCDIDYDASMEFGSEDPADLSKTTRVLTIMLAEDWRGGLLLTDFRGGLSKTTPQASSLDMGTSERKATPISATRLNGDIPDMFFAADMDGIGAICFLLRRGASSTPQQPDMG